MLLYPESYPVYLDSLYSLLVLLGVVGVFKLPLKHIVGCLFPFMETAKVYNKALARLWFIELVFGLFLVPSLLAYFFT